ncbi:hypothetical protein VTJ04DRAFT_2047 [Mycothermus thermophilus]|uniref:uncharacterized protein n=1 Tax=Humicola insolens TaxID=85995 RepID=UPI003743B5C1
MQVTAFRLTSHRQTVHPKTNANRPSVKLLASGFASRNNFRPSLGISASSMLPNAVTKTNAKPKASWNPSELNPPITHPQPVRQ